MNTSPLISIVMATFNRAPIIERAINSVLNQSYKNLELIIIDDGSTDNTIDILGKYKDPRIRLYKHDVNKGVLAAKNTGLRQIKGEWFTIFDSDDELVTEAIERLLSIPLYFDTTITAVTCNCLDSSTNSFSGKGLLFDQYVDDSVSVNTSGEFWGITKTSLLQNDLFNENLGGGGGALEGTLWCKIDDRAKRYYLHAALRIYYTEGDDRESQIKFDLKKELKHYENIIKEECYLNKLKLHKILDYNSLCMRGLIMMKVANNKKLAWKYYDMYSNKNDFLIKLIYKYTLLCKLIVTSRRVKFHLKPYLLKIKN